VRIVISFLIDGWLAFPARPHHLSGPGRRPCAAVTSRCPFCPRSA